MAVTEELRPNPDRQTHLGIRAGELDGKWYGKYWNPVMASLPGHIKEAIDLGPQATPLGLTLEEVGTMTDSGYQDLESGYSLFEDGAMHVAVLTNMPAVAPAMWDWWFWWHASETQRYKLWYPRSHLYAEWSGDGQGVSDRDRYIGGTSFVDEYVGSALGKLAIQFMHPRQLGFCDDKLDQDQATVICGRVGLSEVPLDWGYLLHHVRRVNGGAEMRSRFWMGGKYVAPRGGASLSGDLEGAAEGLRHLGEGHARAMVVHCSQEMNHLGAFLPNIFEEFKRTEIG